MPKTIITCAVTGSAPTPAKNPAVPVTPEEIADSALDAARAGAAVVHVQTALWLLWWLLRWPRQRTSGTSFRRIHALNLELNVGEAQVAYCPVLSSQGIETLA